VAADVRRLHIFLSLSLVTSAATKFWSQSSRATGYRVFQPIVGVDPVPVNVKTVTESKTTLTGLPSGKTVQYDIVSANVAG
jgi:hypothetical protein